MTNGISKVVTCWEREDSSSSEVTEMGLGRKHSNVSGWDGTKGSGVMNNSKKRRIYLLNNTSERRTLRYAHSPLGFSPDGAQGSLLWCHRVI